MESEPLINNREFALLIWLSIITVWACWHQPTRSTLIHLLKVAAARRVVAVFAIAGAYITVCVVILAAIGIWDINQMKATVVWGGSFATFAIVKASTKKKSFESIQEILKDVVSLAAIITFVSEIHSFNLWVEIAIIPFSAALGMLAASSETKPEFRSARAISQLLLAILGISILLNSILYAYNNWGHMLSVNTVKNFAVPILLSLSFVPFLYAIMLLAVFENIMLTSAFRSRDQTTYRYAFFRGLAVFAGRVELLASLQNCLTAVEQLDKSKADQIVRDLWETHLRRRNPPEIPASEGWCPFEAESFLEQDNLKTDAYQPRVHEWQANAPQLIVGERILNGTIRYDIAGEKNAVKRLEVELFASSLSDLEEAENVFRRIAETLSLKAMNFDVCSNYGPDWLNASDFQFNSNLAKLEYHREDHESERVSHHVRCLTITHHTYNDPFSIS